MRECNVSTYLDGRSEDVRGDSPYEVALRNPAPGVWVLLGSSAVGFTGGMTFNVGRCGGTPSTSWVAPPKLGGVLWNDGFSDQCGAGDGASGSVSAPVGFAEYRPSTSWVTSRVPPELDDAPWYDGLKNQCGCASRAESASRRRRRRRKNKKHNKTRTIRKGIRTPKIVPT